MCQFRNQRTATKNTSLVPTVCDSAVYTGKTQVDNIFQNRVTNSEFDPDPVGKISLKMRLKTCRKYEH